MTHPMNLRKRSATGLSSSPSGAKKAKVTPKQRTTAPKVTRPVSQKTAEKRGRSATATKGDVELAMYVKSPVSGAWILWDGPAFQKLTRAQQEEAKSTMKQRPRRSKSRSRSRSRLETREALKKKPITRQQVEDILAQKTARIEDLEETLDRTTQPHLRRKLQAQIEAQRAGTARYAPTRGWAARAPKPGKARERLYSACGPDAFLLPNKEQRGKSKFPIAAKCGTGTEGMCDCKIDCGGVQAAYNRARQYKYDNVAAAAQEILQNVCRK